VIFNTQLLQEVVKRQRGLEKDKISFEAVSSQLPLTSYESVLALEQKVSHVALIGGATIKDCQSDNVPNSGATVGEDIRVGWSAYSKTCFHELGVEKCFM
jgi:hypothetical protein